MNIATSKGIGCVSWLAVGCLRDPEFDSLSSFRKSKNWPTMGLTFALESVAGAEFLLSSLRMVNVGLIAGLGDMGTVSAHYKTKLSAGMEDG